jgi:hypothetical protein
MHLGKGWEERAAVAIFLSAGFAKGLTAAMLAG